MIKISKEMKRKLKKDGIIINITSSPEIYFNNWISFTGNYFENKKAKSGDIVRIEIKETGIVADDFFLD